MLPPTFIVDVRCENFPDFVCDKCNARVPALTICHMITEDEKEWLRLDSSKCRDISKYKKILEKQRKIFHEGHANILNVKAFIIDRLPFGLKGVSNELLIEYIKYFEEVAEYLKVLVPCEFQMYPFHARLLRLFYYFAYLYNIYFIHSRDTTASNMSIPIDYESHRLFYAKRR